MNLKDLINILIDADKKQENKESEAIEDAKTVKSDSIVTPKEETKEIKTEIDPRDARIKELTDLLAQKDAIITQNTEQINALKDLTSVNNPINQTELSLEELIQKGEF